VKYGDEIVFQNQRSADGSGNDLRWLERHNQVKLGGENPVKLDNKAAVWKIVKSIDETGSGCVSFDDEVIIQNQYPPLWLLQRNSVPTWAKEEGAGGDRVAIKAAVWKMRVVTKSER